MLNLHRFLCMIGKMKTNLLKVVVVVAVMLVGFTVTAAPFANDYVVENANSTLFSNDIDINKYGNHLQKRNIQVKKVDYNYSQRAEQSRRVSIVNGAERVSSMPQVTLQNKVLRHSGACCQISELKTVAAGGKTSYNVENAKGAPP